MNLKDLPIVHGLMDHVFPGKADNPEKRARALRAIGIKTFDADDPMKKVAISEAVYDHLKQLAGQGVNRIALAAILLEEDCGIRWIGVKRSWHGWLSIRTVSMSDTEARMALTPYIDFEAHFIVGLDDEKIKKVTDVGYVFERVPVNDGQWARLYSSGPPF